MIIKIGIILLCMLGTILNFFEIFTTNKKEKIAHIVFVVFGILGVVSAIYSCKTETAALISNAEQVGAIENSNIFYDLESDEYFAIKTRDWDFFDSYERMPLDKASVEGVLSELQSLERERQEVNLKNQEIFEKQLELDKIKLEDLK